MSLGLLEYQEPLSVYKCQDFQGTEFFVGRFVGRATSDLLAYLEMYVGGCTFVGGGGLTILSGGSLAEVSVPTAIGGAAVTAHGAGVLVRNTFAPITFARGSGSEDWRPLGVDDLPPSYEAPKGGPRKVTVQDGPYKGRSGWLDENGNIWVPSKPGESHGGPHWDVQIKGGKGGHFNVYP